MKITGHCSRTVEVCVFRIWSRFLLFVFLALSGLRAGAADAAMGAIEGRVFNATSGRALVNARVVLEGTTREAITDESGSFRLAGVPAGEARLGVSYIGMERQTVTVEVPAGGRRPARVRTRSGGAGGRNRQDGRFLRHGGSRDEHPGDLDE